MERVASVRRELVRRGEFLPPGWVDEAVEDLRHDRLTGFVLLAVGGAPGIAFVSRRPRRAYGHAHVEPGPDARERTVALLRSVLDGLPEAIDRADIGVTGLSEVEEAELGRTFSHPPGGAFLTRIALERAVRPPSEDPLATLSVPLRHWPIRSVPLDSLHELDWAAFLGTPDATLVADTPEENRQMLGELLEGRLGPFLDHASTALADTEGRLVGAIMVAQQSATRAIVLDLMIDPKGRRRGIATYLMLWSIRALRALGYETVSLWVTESNVGARQLYERLGFRPRLTALIYRWARAP
jgi:ribosomal protein S18 acetylase RimI-like enzyme